MRITTVVLALIVLSFWLGLPVRGAKKIPDSTRPSDERGPVSADLNDSDSFLQNTIRGKAPERDNSQKIEALLKEMTLEEKVGQMTQLTMEMIATGRDQNVSVDPAKLDKAIGKYGVGSI